VAHRWLAHERPRHQFASSVLVISLRVLAITLPLLLLAIAALVADGSEESTPDLVGLMLI
jgi:hypothetical protein